MRYVILKHVRANDTHWDFMIEQADSLLTWRIGFCPSAFPDTPFEAVKIFDHPLRFLDYEGPVQNGTGSVAREDVGRCEMISQSTNSYKFTLEGLVLHGGFELTCQSGDKWLFSQL